MTKRGVADYFVYVLICLDRHGCRTYVGWTLDFERRLAEHNAGRGARSTRGRVWSLLHVEKLATRGEAMSREWQLKRDRAFRKRLVESWLAAARPAQDFVDRYESQGREKA